jgi:hypothetical protein
MPLGLSGIDADCLAEAVRFELTDPLEPLVFKTSAIDHSTTLPYCLVPPPGIEPR